MSAWAVNALGCDDCWDDLTTCQSRLTAVRKELAKSHEDKDAVDGCWRCAFKWAEHCEDEETLDDMRECYKTAQEVYQICVNTPDYRCAADASSYLLAQ